MYNSWVSSADPTEEVTFARNVLKSDISLQLEGRKKQKVLIFGNG